MRRNNACTSITLYVYLDKSMFSSDRGNGDNTFTSRHQNLTLVLLGPNFRQTLSQRFSSSNLVFSKYLIFNLNYSLIPSSSIYLVSHANSCSVYWITRKNILGTAVQMETREKIFIYLK